MTENTEDFRPETSAVRRPAYIPADQPHSARGSDVVPPYAVGDRIGDQYIVRQIHGGGMAWVFVVFDEQHQVPRALKTHKWEKWPNLCQRAQLQRAMEREASIWVGLSSHPNIVRARWADHLDARFFLALEFVPPPLGDKDGMPRTLADELGGAPLPADRVLRLALQITDGMLHAHGNGIECHRDLKPHNLMITHEGHVKVTDFGLALPLVSEAPALETRTDGADGARRRRTPEAERTDDADYWPPGTPGYHAPEQHQRRPDLDARTDVYAFGLILCQMLTGSVYPPFYRQESTPREAHERQMAEPPPRVAESWQPIVNRCLAPDRHDRYPDFGALQQDLRNMYRDRHGQPWAPVSAVATENWEKRNRAVSLMSLGMTEEAVSLCDEVLSEEPESVSALNTRAVAYATAGEHWAALRDYGEAIRLGTDAERTSCHCNRGAVWLDLNHPEKALSDYDLALDLNPDLPQAHAGRGAAYALMGRLSEAKEAFDAAIRLSDRYPSHYIGRGGVLADLGHLEAALADYDAAINLNPLRADAYCDRGHLRIQQEQIDAAVADLQMAILLEPASAIPWANLGDAFAADGRWPEAERSYTEALHRDCDNVIFWNSRGRARAEQQKFDEAACDFQEAIERRPDYAGAWLNYALVQESLGHMEEAVRSYGQVLETAPPDDERSRAMARQELARLQAAMGSAPCS